VTYDATAHTATGTATGVGGVNLAADLTLSGTTHTSAGTYAADNWSFTDPAGNYASASGTVSDKINQASATINVTPYNVTYDANAHTALGTATGVGGVNLAADLTLSGTTHTSAGTYVADSWSFTDPAGNYASASATVTDKINQANATINVTPYTVTYDGTAHTATGTATGVGGVNLAADLTLSGTTHTSAGTYAADNWSFTDPAGNYASASGTVSDKINQASATINVTPYTVTYDANAHTALGTATGVGGVNLAADLTLSGTTHTNAGTYATDGWSFTDPAGNYASTSGTVSDKINQASATINVTPYTVTYDANAHTALGTATGVGGVNLAADLTLSGTTHTSAGTYAADNWSFTDPAGNYASASATVTDKINQANATINVTPYTVIYDGTAHTALGTATGVGGVNLAADLTLSGTTHTSAGTYAADNWSFTDPAGNYASASATVTDKINQANATINVTPYNVTYDATAHTATGTATGVGGVNLAADLTLTGTTHTSTGTYAADRWSFTDPAGNYASTSGTVSDKINQASQTITYSPAVTTYTYSLSGAFGLSASASSGLTVSFASTTLGVCTVSGTTAFIVSAGTCTIQATQTGDTNYLTATTVPVNYTISPASQTITFPVGINPSTPAITTYTYSVGGSFTLKASTNSGLAASFASTTPGVCTVSGTTAFIVSAGTCTIQATQTGNTDYLTATPVTANYTISQASQTISYLPAVTTYTYSAGGSFSLSASSSAGLTVSFASLSGGVCTVTGTTAYIVTGGTCTIQATQTGNTDYSAATPVSVNYTISQVMPTITLVSSLNPILLQNPVTYTATVSSTAGKPTGTVTFEDGGVAISTCTGVPVTVSTGVASCAVIYTATGTHSITVLYNGDTNFLSAGPSNTVSESAIDIILSVPVTGSSETILPGSTATYSFPIAPSSGTSFPTAVTFTVTGLPTGVVASLAPSAWSLTSSNPWSWTLPANTTLTGNTVLSIQVPQTTATVQPAGGAGSNLASRLAPFSLALLLLPFAGRLRKSGKRLGRLLSVLLLLGAGMAAMAGLSGCGSNTGFFAQTQQSYTVTVTVSSGSLSHTSTVTLTVE
jgi:hypothetical protein